MDISTLLTLLAAVAVQSTLFGFWGGKLASGVRENKEAIAKSIGKWLVKNANDVLPKINKTVN